MQDKKSSSLVDLSNFKRTKDLIRNQALNKNLSNSKSQKTAPIQLTEKLTEVFPGKVTVFSGFSGRLCFFHFRLGKFLWFALLLYIQLKKKGNKKRLIGQN